MGLFFCEFNMDEALEVACEESYDDKEIEKKGDTEGIISTAKSLLDMRFPIESIAKATGLSELV